MPEQTALGELVARAGAASLPYHDPMFPDCLLWLHAACPPDWHNGMPVLFVHHGVRRNGSAYRDWWLPYAHGMLVVAIEFPEASFPDYLCYHFGNLHDAAGAARRPERWTYGIGPRLFAALRTQGITTAARYGLFGHSAGGQFVHRMLSFGYREHVAVAVSANAGTYAMPDRAIDWPWGLGGVPADDLTAVLGFPLTIMAGTEDTKTTSRFFPGGPKSMRQGANRFERAHAYLRAGRDAAAALGVACRWRLIEVPGVGHDGKGMSAAAAPVLAQALAGPAPAV
jgi:hypothetical protein